MRAPHGYFLDLLSEEVACTAGVLLTDGNIRTIANRDHIEDLIGLERSDGGTTVFRPEDFEDAVLQVRVSIGDLKDTKPGMFIANGYDVELRATRC